MEYIYQPQGNIRSKYIVNILLVSIYLFLAITPLNNIVGIDKVVFLISLLWFFQTVSIGPAILKTSTFKLWMLFYLWQLTMLLIGNSSVSPFLVLMRLNVFLVPTMGLFILKYYNIKETQFLFKLFFGLMYIVLLVNCVIGLLNPMAFDDDSNLAGTAMIATFLIFAGSCIYLYRHTISRLRRCVLLSVVLVFIFFITVVNARGIAFLLFVFMLFLFYMSQYRGNKVALVFRLFVFGSIGIALLIPILEYISTLSGVSERLVEKFTEIINIVDDKQIDTDILSAEGSMELRLALSVLSLQTFVSNGHFFLIGCGEHYIDASELADIVRAGVGCHSEFIDVLARYGIVGALLIYSAVCTTISEIKKYIADNVKISEMTCVFVIFVTYSILNLSLYSSMLVTIFIFLPIAVKLYPKI